MKVGKTVLGIMTGMGIITGTIFVNKTSRGRAIVEKAKDLFDGGRAKKVVLDCEQFNALFSELEKTHEEIQDIKHFIAVDMIKQLEENDLVQRKQLNELKVAIEEIKSKL